MPIILTIAPLLTCFLPLGYPLTVIFFPQHTGDMHIIVLKKPNNKFSAGLSSQCRCFGQIFIQMKRKHLGQIKKEGREINIPLNHIHMHDPTNKSTPTPQSTSEEKIKAH